MAINDKTRKLLWGRSGNRCAFCRNELIMDASREDDESIVGEECHIISGKPNGPRYDTEFPADQVDSYTNLILLCRVHHKMIDDQSETFKADIIYQLKANHERWVSDALNSAAFLEDLTVTKSMESAFLKIKTAMPELIAEMKEDLSQAGNKFIREFFIVSKRWTLNAGVPCFIYYFEDHEGLQGKIHVLENHSFVIDVTRGNAKKYRMMENFVDLVVAS